MERDQSTKSFHSSLPDPNAIKCEVCGKGFKSQILLKNHIGYHKEKTFVCEEPDCDKKFLFAVSCAFKDLLSNTSNDTSK